MSLDIVTQQYEYLENEVVKLNDTIHFTEKNMGAYGFKIYALLFQSSNLFEQINKELCIRSKCKGLKCEFSHWKTNVCVTKEENTSVLFIHTGKELKPLKGFSIHTRDNPTMQWWDAYNNVKHNISRLECATLENLILSLGANAILLNAYINKSDKTNFQNPHFQTSKLFSGVNYSIWFPVKKT